MKAAIWTAYGNPTVLKVEEIEKPIPKNNEILVKVYSSAVTTGDCRMRRFDVPNGMWLLTRLAFGVFKPRKSVSGMDFSGEVFAVGHDVSQFKVGDRVFGTTGMELGANADYLCIAQDKAVVTIPSSITYTDAAALIFGGLAVLHFLKGIINVGSKVLINGASGAVGSAAIQISKHFEADVTGVCSSGNTALVVSIGADNVIDYTKENFTDNGEVYDVILDTVGNLSYNKCQKSLAKGGKLILINAGLGTILSSLFNRQLICGVAEENKALLLEILKLYQSNGFKPVIDEVYPLNEIVKAHEYVDKGHKKGNVVLSHTD
ncbi:NAD(P)-dependent alcohol dehydrogenase [Thalassotalea marina]|uniref:NADPH:quinone reductase n=1 Tax=Thalassotalea marina TaxID=1673741 RepID=A0A919EQ23_9GAMM|nr:NAD(P)-dependent alcohol dehydrogenase [Thalassotalea marina]GHG06185.1 NADPH:quinone reductase [Thalassotalea marina]